MTPADLAATIFSRFGFDPATQIREQLGRPYQISDGRPIEAVFIRARTVFSSLEDDSRHGADHSQAFPQAGQIKLIWESLKNAS